MARGVDDVDLVVFPGAVCGCRLDGDAPFFFQLHGVHCGADPVFTAYLMNSMNTLGIKKNSFCQGCLA